MEGGKVLRVLDILEGVDPLHIPENYNGVIQNILIAYLRRGCLSPSSHNATQPPIHQVLHPLQTTLT